MLNRDGFGQNFKHVVVTLMTSVKSAFVTDSLHMLVCLLPEAENTKSNFKGILDYFQIKEPTEHHSNKTGIILQGWYSTDINVPTCWLKLHHKLRSYTKLHDTAFTQEKTPEWKHRVDTREQLEGGDNRGFAVVSQIS